MATYTALFHDERARKVRKVQKQGRALLEQMSGASMVDISNGRYVDTFDNQTKGRVHEFCFECADKKQGGDGKRYPEAPKDRSRFYGR